MQCNFWCPSQERGLQGKDRASKIRRPQFARHQLAEQGPLQSLSSLCLFKPFRNQHSEERCRGERSGTCTGLRADWSVPKSYWSVKLKGGILLKYLRTYSWHKTSFAISFCSGFTKWLQPSLKAAHKYDPFGKRVESLVRWWRWQISTCKGYGGCVSRNRTALENTVFHAVYGFYNIKKCNWRWTYAIHRFFCRSLERQIKCKVNKDSIIL